MKTQYINKLKELGFLESNAVCTIYGQEIIDNFLELLIKKLKQNEFKHYNKSVIKENKLGKYYYLTDRYIEMSLSKDNINNEALDLQYLFSKFLKDTLGISLIEGTKIVYNYNYYCGYIYLNKPILMYIVKQNKYNTYIKFDLFNIFYSIIKENTYLSYLIAPKITIIPLHQNKSGVLSYANKIKETLLFNSEIDDRNISPSLKIEKAKNERVPLIIYSGPKEYKNQNLIIEYNNFKETISINDLNKINDYLLITLKNKYNQNLKDIYLFDRELTVLNNLSKIIKVNICDRCNIDQYKYLLTPFNRISKTNRCVKCNKEVNNILYLTK